MTHFLLCISYLQDGRYRLEDVYGKTPFTIKVDTSSYQLKGKQFKVETLENNQVRLSLDFNPENSNLEEQFTMEKVVDKRVRQRLFLSRCNPIHILPN